MNADAGAVDFFRAMKNSKVGEDRRTFAQICARMAPRVIEADVDVHHDGIGAVIVESGIDLLKAPDQYKGESPTIYSVRLAGWRAHRRQIYKENPHLAKPADLDDEPSKVPKTGKS